VAEPFASTTTVEPFVSGDVGATAHCPACGSTAIGSLRSIPDHEYGLAHRATYASCARCGTLAQFPMPGLLELAAFYPDEYHSMHAGGLLQRMRHDLRIRRLKRFAGTDGPILDYGCGDGSFLVRAAAHMPGRALFGFELGEKREMCQLAGGAVTILKGYHADLLDVLPACRVVTMNHVIEHLPDPFAIVASLSDRLLPGGCFEGQTPNAASTELRVFGARWSGYHAPRHTVVFSARGLESLLERAGFERVQVSAGFNPAGIAVSLGSLAHGDAPGTIRRQGARWTALLLCAAALSPLDLVPGAPGMINFIAHKKKDSSDEA
jgi:SAM-dependent methyltransferase